MLSIKTHKSVEQIAKKHRIDVSFVKRQLDMGIPIEHEHTKNKDLATDIALQHLDEIPDYYTRLKKMEASAKKEHKKFKDVKEDAVTDLQRGVVELDDASYDNIDSLMRRIMKKRNVTAKKLHNDFVKKHHQTPDTWAKINRKKLNNVKEETDGKSAKDPGYSLRDWFKDGSWVQTGGKYDGKPCARQPGQTTKPYCRDPDDRSAMSKEERNKRAAKKRREDPNPNRTGKAKMVTQESAGEKDACYKKVKRRYKVWPSAYASGALVKCRKVGADNWGTKNEAVNAAQQAAIAISMKKKGIKPKSEINEKCWDGYEQHGMKKKGKKMVPNCVSVKEESEMIRYCPKCNKNETRSQCKYGEKYWDMFSRPSALDKKFTPNSPHTGNFPESYDHEYSMARSEISTIISAAKRLKKKIGKGEGNIEAWVQSKITKAADYLDTAADYVDSGEMAKEDVSIEDANGNLYAEFIDIIKSDRLKPSVGIGSKLIGENISNEPKLKSGSGLGGGRRVYEKGKEPKSTGAKLPKLPTVKNMDENCNSNLKTFQEFMIEASPAWQRKAGKNPKGGLNAAGIASYRKEHPGSKLSLAVTTKPSKLKKGSKKWKRRKSFCARMSGMPGPMKDEKGRPTRKALSLRKWNC